MAFDTAFSNCRNRQDRSKKGCVCGGHSRKARKRRKPWRGRGRRVAAKRNLVRCLEDFYRIYLPNSCPRCGSQMRQRRWGRAVRCRDCGADYQLEPEGSPDG